MLEAEKFIPPYPAPHKSKLSAAWRFVHGWNSWIHTLFEKSYSMQMGHVRTRKLDLFVVNDLKLVREITEERPDDFPKHSLQHDILCPLLGNNIFTANGPDWRRQRAMVDPAFAHTRLVQSFPTMLAASENLIARLAAMPLDRPLAIDPVMTHVTADIIFRTILSRRLDEAGAAAIFENFATYQDVTQRIITCSIHGLPAFWLHRRQRRAAANIRAQLAPLIAARYRARHDGGASEDDILGSLLDARAPGTGAAFALTEVTNQVAMLFLAGHETSASALSWSLYLLARCPHLQEAIRAEINVVLGPGGKFNSDALKQLVQTRNLFKETLRLYPPVSFLPRQSLHDEYLRDKNVPQGAMVTIAPWLLHRHRRIWTDPDRFDPDRFDDPAQADAISGAYLPFGRGQRICVGQGFALQEAVLVLAQVARRFHLRACSTPEPVSRITLRAKRPIQLLLTPL